MSRKNEIFVKERLVEARESRSINQTQLSELIGLSRQAISQYESGERTPTLDVITRMAQALNFPVHRFNKTVHGRERDALYFRSFASATKMTRNRARRLLEWVAFDISDYLSRFVEVPSVNFPSPLAIDDPLEITPSAIERAATETRRYWGLGDGPISDLTLLLENNGAVVVHQSDSSGKLDAFSCWNNSCNRPFVVLCTDKSSAVRIRMNAAHELAHLVLHRNLRPALISRKDTHKLLEQQARYFAGAFLLPKDSFLAEVPRPNLNSFAAIKTRWRVAIQAMVVRAKNLGAISQSEQERLFVYLSQRGWRKNEPFDDELPIEKPRLMERTIDLVFEHNLATKSSMETDIGLYASDIEKSIGLKDGYFKDAELAGRFSGLRLVN